MTQTSPIVFSIIIPHYESPGDLRRCLDSVPERNDIELIVVDDCSCRETVAEISSMTAEKGGQLLSTAIHSGGGAARNVGLKAAKGRFILFADCDDVFTEDMQMILEDHKDSTADMIFFGAEAQGTHYMGYDPVKKLNKKIEENDTTWLRFLFGEPWCKITRKEVIDRWSIRFDEVWRNNDTTYSYLVGFHAGDVAVDRRKGYRHIVHSGSTSDNRENGVLLSSIEVLARKNQFLKKNGTGVYDSSIYSFFKEIRRKKNNLLRVKAIFHAAKYGCGWTAFRYFVFKKQSPPKSYR